MYGQFQPNMEYYRQKAQEAAFGIPPQYQQMYQQPPQSQMQMNIPQSQPGMICRAVTGIEEARAAFIDPLSTNVFTDLANGKIYIKKIDNSGLSSLTTFTIENTVDKPVNYDEKITALDLRVTELEGKKNEHI